MKTLNLAEARDNFCQLADTVHSLGEGVIIAKYGHPFVMPLRGLPYRMADDFDAPMPELSLSVAESGPEFGASVPRGIAR